jgi:glycosyltransferase involved in cell wall biosynthesis
MPQPEDRVNAHLQATGRKANPRPSVGVVMPTLCEASNLPHVIPRLPAWIDELIVVDGHSTDDTVAVARELFPDVRVVYQSGRGKGDALKCGIEAANADIVVTLDADGSTAPEEIPRFVNALEKGADLAKGSRFLRGGGSDDLTLLRRSGNRGLTLLVNVLFGTRYSDLCYGYNALWKRRARDIDIDVDGFEVETLLALRAARARLKVVEVPSWEARRIHGGSNLNALRDGWRILKLIVCERTLRRPASSLTNELRHSVRRSVAETSNPRSADRDP